MYSTQIKLTTNEISDAWNDIANGDIFLSISYLKSLEEGIPSNMQLFFVEVYATEKLVGIALVQYIEIKQLATLGERDPWLHKHLRNFCLKKFCPGVLVVGNNLLTGNHGFRHTQEITPDLFLESIENSLHSIQNLLKIQNKKASMITWKDYSFPDYASFFKPKKYVTLHAQPNMVFQVKKQWKDFESYKAALQKKYRQQLQRAQRKIVHLEKKKLDIHWIEQNEDQLHTLYYAVAENAPFNTFILPKNHFSALKKHLNEHFYLYGYFDQNVLIGFSTLIANGKQMDTYFLGYNPQVQKNYLLYLNMLYDMVAFSINQGFEKIIFGRTALEIKSSIGAEPEEVIGWMHHQKPFIHRNLAKITKWVEPKATWTVRHPFTEKH
ncbi:MAG: 8-amino-7-oxononanoate synthase [Flavobacterium sp.]